MPIRIEGTKDTELLSILNCDVQNIHYEIEPSLFKPYSKEDMKKFFEEVLNEKNTCAFVAYYENCSAGYVLISKKDVPETQYHCNLLTAYIDQICVEKNFKGKGIGKALIDFVKDFARKNKIKRVALDYSQKNLNAGNFFRSQGFETYIEKREAVLELREKLMYAEEQRLAGEPTISLDEVQKRMKERINAKV